MTSTPTITTLFDDDDSPNESFYVPDDAPDVRVVSQSQGTEPFDHLLNAVALRVEDINSPTPKDTTALQLEAYEDDGMNYQVPQPAANLISAGDARAVLSPAKKSLLSLFEAQNKNNKRDGSHLIDAAKGAKKKKKIRVKPATSICGFLRDSAIEAKVTELKAKKTAFNVNSDIKSALTSWHNKRVISYAPFQKMKDLFVSAPHPLMMDDHRLLLEDFMMLQPGDVVMCLISKSHPLVSNKKGSLKAVFQETMEHDLYRPVQFSRTVYFPLKLMVRSNINYNDFVDGNLEETDVSERCTKQYGGGITFWFMRKYGQNDNIAFMQESHCLFFSNFLKYPKSILFFKRSHPATRLVDIKNYLRNWKDMDRLAAAVRIYLDEVYGDPLMTYSLSEFYEHIVKRRNLELEHKAYKDAPVSDAKVEKRLVLKNNDAAFDLFRNYMDEKCRSAIEDLYGKFSVLTKPILSQRLLSDLTRRFKQTLPQQHHAIMCLLNKRERINQVSSKKLEPQWDRYALYIFCLLMRIRNPHNFVHWAMCNAASDWGHGGAHMAVFFGLAVAQTTLLRRLTKLNTDHSFTMKTIVTLSMLYFVIATFDNSQVIRKKKFQGGGSTSFVTLVTSRMFIKPTIPYLLFLFTFPTDRPAITYIDQAIPSPHGMPAYESESIITAKSFSNPQFQKKNQSTNVDGSRVERYVEMVQIAHMVNKLRRLLPFWCDEFKFQNEDHQESMAALRIVPKLRSINRKPSSTDKAGFLIQCGEFSLYATRVWRGKLKAAEAIIPPVSPDDETTNIGAAKNILSLLLLHGILKPVDSEGASGNMRKLRLADNYEKRWMMLVGDGLTQIRIRTFIEIIEKTCYDFGEQQEKTEMIKKAMGQVIHVTGDLHGGLFHFLSAIYSLFYGSLIQPIQVMLGWKRISGTDVSKCYQQAAGLVLMASDEIERQLICAFFHEVFNDPTRRAEFRSYTDPEEFAVMIAKGFRKWLVTKRSVTTDETFRKAICFVQLTAMYKEFRLALRNGDAIMIEWLYNQFLPIFDHTGKKHYFDIVCGMIERFYGSLEYHLLHLIRINRTVPLYEGNDTDGRPMASWAVDGLIELIQKFYHKMNFKNDSLDGWMQHSPHLQLNNKSIRFATTEYSRVFSDTSKSMKFGDRSENDLDIGRNKKASSVPKRLQEHLAVAEFCKLNKLCLENPGRIYIQKDIWDSLSNITTPLTIESEAEKSTRWMDHVLSDEERALSSMADDIFSDQEKNKDRNACENGIDSNATDVSIEFNEIGEGGVREDGSSEEVNVLGDESDPVVVIENVAEGEKEDVEISVKIGRSKKKITIRRAKVNELSLCDIFAVARTNLLKKNLPVTRYRRKLRSQREQQRKKRLLEQINAERGRSLLLNEAFDRLRSRRRDVV